MSDATDNLVLEQLRLMRTELADVKRAVTEGREDVLALRRDIHALRGESLRRDESAAEMSVWRDRVERRLELRDQ